MSLDRRIFVKSLLLTVVASACAAPAASPTAAPKPATTASGKAAPSPAAAKPTEQPAAKAPATSKPPVDVTLRLDWRAIGYHSAFWAAIDKGFYAERGVKVTLGEGQGSGSTLQLVASGTQMFGYLDAGVLAQGVQRGIEAKMLAIFFQRNMYGFLSPKDAPITKPEQLVGKRLAGSTGGAGEVQWPIFAKRTGIDASKVTFIATDPPGKYAALMSKRVDVSVHQVPTDALDYEGQNFPVERMLYADYGLDRLGHGLVALNKTIADQPDVARAVVAGTIKGWDYARQNPDETVALGSKFFQTNLTPATLAAQWRATFDFHRSARTKGKPTGLMDKADWEDTQKLLVEAEYLKETLPVDRYFTNEYLPS